MEIILAKTAGFCMGVKRAMQIAIETAQNSENKNVYTCGPLIHNPQAVDFLAEKGIKSTANWEKICEGTIIIRAHGIPKQDQDQMAQKGISLVDATCPHVVTSQKQIKKYFDLGYFIIIIGDKRHPEIQSLQSYAPQKHLVISSMEEVNSTNIPDKVMVIAQTTFSLQEFEKISKAICQKASDCHISNSICLATSERQKEIRELAEKVNAVIVVGGKQSANTRRLAEIASSLCPKTFHVETAKELVPNNFININKVAVTAGASTPDFITEKVISWLKDLTQ